MVKCLVFIREVFGSNVGRNKDNPAEVFPGVSQFLQPTLETSQIRPQQPHSTSYIIQYLLLILPLAFRSLATERVLK